MGVGLKPASLRERFTAGQTVPALSGYCEESRGWTSFCQAQRKGNQLASRVTQLPRVPAAQQVVWERRGGRERRLEALRASGRGLCRDFGWRTCPMQGPGLSGEGGGLHAGSAQCSCPGRNPSLAIQDSCPGFCTKCRWMRLHLLGGGCF